MNKKWKTKIKKTLPGLTKIVEKAQEDEQQTKIEDHFNNLFKPIKQLDFIPQYPSSNESDDLDAFKDYHPNCYLGPSKDNPDKYYTKFEADMKIANSFTDDFKQIIKEIREEKNLTLHDLFEESEAVKEILNKPKQYNFVQQKNGPEIKWPTIKPSIPKSEFEKLSLNSSNKSALWNVLAAHSSPTFHITPPGYNAYEQLERHWMEKSPIPWEDLENSHMKCEKWLNYPLSDSSDD